MKKTILIVDDEVNIRMLLEHFLGEEYNVFTSEDGNKAFDWLTEGNHTDLILADLEMPVTNGFELLIKLRENKLTQEIPCLVVTGKVKTENYIKSFRLGAKDYLQKPFKAEEIKTRVETILNEKKD